MINLAVTRSTTVRRAARSTTGCFWPLSASRASECSTLLQSGAPEYFLDAYNEHANWLPNGTDWALGIESADNRSRDQLHIHISRLIPDARKDIDKRWKAIATDESKWKDSVITVLGKKFRAWNVATLNHNLFKHLNDDIVTPFKVQMRNQTMLVTGCAPTRATADRPQQRQGRSNTNPGANNIEFLLDKG